LLTGLNDASLLYPFLYKHLFFFKYFRNSLFYLWLALTPIFIFLVCHQFDQFLEDIQHNNSGKIRALIFLIIPVAAFLAYLRTLDQPLGSSYVIITLSVILLGYLRLNHTRRHHRIILAILAVLIVAQPLEVYHHLSRNAVGGVVHKYYAEHFLDIFHGTPTAKPSRESLSKLAAATGSLYYTTPEYNDLFKNIPEPVLKYYLSHKFLIYDHARGISDRETALRQFPDLIVNESNLAFFDAAESHISSMSLPQTQPIVIRVSKDTQGFKLLDYTANAITFETSFREPKFLVYNDNYHPDWKAYTDGKKTPIYKANLAFKGLWIPAGRHVHHLTFGSQGLRWLNGALLLIFHVMLWITMALRIRNV
ncbi:MAG: hypothetical protein K8I00_03565, partial [Candidatus Omnitrophica bacterium]|nr:hypothetical protein [Candidatus Omnitrophota bacterium]